MKVSRGTNLAATRFREIRYSEKYELFHGVQVYFENQRFMSLKYLLFIYLIIRSRLVCKYRIRKAKNKTAYSLFAIINNFNNSNIHFPRQSYHFLTYNPEKGFYLLGHEIKSAPQCLYRYILTTLMAIWKSPFLF